MESDPYVEYSPTWGIIDDDKNICVIKGSQYYQFLTLEDQILSFA